MLIIFDQQNPIESFSTEKYDVDEIFVDILGYDKISNQFREKISNKVWKTIKYSILFDTTRIA